MRPEQNRDKFRYFHLGVTIFLVIAAGLILAVVLFRISDIQNAIGAFLGAITAVIYGAVISYILTPMCNSLDKKLIAFFGRKKALTEKQKNLIRGIDVFICLMFMLILIIGVIALVLPQLIDSLTTLYNEIPAMELRVKELLQNISKKNPDVADTVQKMIDSALDYIQNFFNNDLIPNLTSIVTNVTSGLWSALALIMNIFIGFIVAAYLMGSRKNYAGQAKKLLYACFKRKTANSILNEVRFANQAFSGFISGKLLDSLLIGMICYIATIILQTPYAMLVSVLVGVTNIIPFFGPYIGAILSAFIILLNDLSTPWPCISFVIFLLIMMQVDANIISPKILGDKTGLNGFWVLFSILLFGGLFGFIGMLIGVPVFAVIYHELRRLIHSMLKKKKLQTSTDYYIRINAIDDDGLPVYPEEKEADNDNKIKEYLKKNLPHSDEKKEASETEKQKK